MASTDISLEHASSPPPTLRHVWTAHIPPVKSQYKPLKTSTKLYCALFALQFSNMMCFIDSMAAPPMMSTLSRSLNCGATIV